MIVRLASYESDVACQRLIREPEILQFTAFRFIDNRRERQNADAQIDANKRPNAGDVLRFHCHFGLNTDPAKVIVDQCSRGCARIDRIIRGSRVLPSVSCGGARSFRFRGLATNYHFFAGERHDLQFRKIDGQCNDAHVQSSITNLRQDYIGGLGLYPNVTFGKRF